MADDPKFEQGKVLPIILEPCDLPPEIKAHEPLYVDLTGARDSQPEPWLQIMRACEADIGTSVPDWLGVFHKVTSGLQDRHSINLLVAGKPKWREFIAQLKLALPCMGIVDLESGRTVTRRGLVTEILNALAGYKGKIASGEDLAVLERVLESTPPSLLALKHFDYAVGRPQYSDLYSILRYLVMEKRQLTLLVQSRATFASLLSDNTVVSSFTMDLIKLGVGSLI
jgi:hypothetical protein